MSPFLSRRSLVGSLRALTSAEMVALKCNTAARTGFLLAALHSVAERVNPRNARPLAPHCARVPTSAGRPHLSPLGEEAASSGLSDLSRAGARRDGSTRGERSYGRGGGGVR